MKDCIRGLNSSTTPFITNLSYIALVYTLVSVIFLSDLCSPFSNLSKRRYLAALIIINVDSPAPKLRLVLQQLYLCPTQRNKNRKSAQPSSNSQNSSSPAGTPHTSTSKWRSANWSRPTPSSANSSKKQLWRSTHSVRRYISRWSISRNWRPRMRSNDWCIWWKYIRQFISSGV